MRAPTARLSLVLPSLASGKSFLNRIRLEQCAATRLRVLRPQLTAAMSGSAAAPRERVLDRLQNVKNARDLAESTTAIQPGRVYRAACPADATLADVLLVRRSLRVGHMLDFRSEEERSEDPGWVLMLSNGTVRTYDSAGAVTEVSVDHNAALGGLRDLPDIAMHRLSLLDRRALTRGLMRRLPLAKAAAAVACHAVGAVNSVRGIIVPEINKGGLLLIYQVLLETAGPDLLRMLRIVACAAAAREPILLFCKLGKDRTGIAAALVLAAAGAPDEDIVADYARSDGVDAVALGGIERSPDVQGMDREIFARARPDTMRAVLQHVREKYGGPCAYMESIGFSAGEQAALRASLAEPRPWPREP